MKCDISRRTLFGLLTSAAAGLVVGGRPARAADDSSQGMVPISGVTGHGPNPYWNSVGPFVTYHGRVSRVEFSEDEGQTWLEAGSARIMGRTPSPAGSTRGPRAARADTSWRCERVTSGVTYKQTRPCGIPAAISGTGSSVRKSWWDVRAEE